MIKYLLVILSIWTPCIPLFTQCMSTSPQSPTSANNDITVGSVPWSNETNAFSSNDTRAEAGLLILGSNTNYLAVSGFGFSIPSNAIICGITVDIERRRTGLGTISDNEVRIIKGGNISGTNHALPDSWPGSDQTASYGGSGDLWGETWSAQDINSTNFGVAISASLFLLNILSTAEIDHIAVTVHYELLLPVHLSSFKADRLDNAHVEVTWSTASELESSYFELLKSPDDQNWISCHRTPSIGFSNSGHEYHYLDDNPSPFTTYYQLKYFGLDGHQTSSHIVAVESSNNQEDPMIFPNPSTGQFQVICPHEEANLRLTNLYGIQVDFRKMLSGLNTIDLSHCPPGYYQVTMEQENSVVKKLLLIQ